nr:unnamed protein product [Callosobruchus analis]
MGISNTQDNFIVTKNSRVCERHFAQESILWISSYYDKSTGKTNGSTSPSTFKSRCSSQSSSKMSPIFIKKCNLQKKSGRKTVGY